MQNSAIFSTFIKLPFVIKALVLSIFEWHFTQVLLYSFWQLFVTNKAFSLQLGHGHISFCFNVNHL